VYEDEMVGCPTCGAELTYIAPYQRHYCYGCRSYAPKTLHACKECGRALVFVQQYHKYYCYGCQEYKEDPGIRNPCPTCGEELEYVPQYDRFFCFECKAYAPKDYGITRRRKGGKRMKAGAAKDQAKTIGYAPFSREEMDLASKEQLMKWCRDYGLDDSGMKYELRLRLLEYVRKQGLLLKGEKPEDAAQEEAAESQQQQEEPSGEVVVVEEPEEEKREEEAREEKVEAAQEAEAQPKTVQSAQHPCPTCGQELTYIPQYDRWYCYSCRAYAPAHTGPQAAAQRAQQAEAARTKAVKIRRQRHGNPMVGVSLAVVGLLMFVAYELLYEAPAIFDIPVFLRAPEIGFALFFLSFVFVVMGLIAAVLVLRPRG
jgi:ssDNA-binding Zn-finger/Zn-ribbon topoisomerase 1